MLKSNFGLEEKYGLKKQLDDSQQKVSKKQYSVLHKTLGGLIKRRVIDIDLYSLEKTNDFFSIKMLSSYINDRSRKTDLKSIFRREREHKQ